jgi:hypothetical protein
MRGAKPLSYTYTLSRACNLREIKRQHELQTDKCVFCFKNKAKLFITTSHSPFASILAPIQSHSYNQTLPKDGFFGC